MADSDHGIDRWSKGRPILLGFIHGGFVRYAIPVTVVEDSEQRIALFLVEGTPLRWTTGLRPLTFPISASECKRWDSTNVLMLVEPKATHSTWLMLERRIRRVSRLVCEPPETSHADEAWV
jgi:hypothetical protein